MARTRMTHGAWHGLLRRARARAVSRALCGSTPWQRTFGACLCTLTKRESSVGSPSQGNHYGTRPCRHWRVHIHTPSNHTLCIQTCTRTTEPNSFAMVGRLVVKVMTHRPQLAPLAVRWHTPGSRVHASLPASCVTAWERCGCRPLWFPSSQICVSAIIATQLCD